MKMLSIGDRIISLLLATCLALFGTPISGMNAWADEQAGFSAHFACDQNVSVTAYDTQDLTQQGHSHAEYAYARSSATGEIDTSGDGQVNFTVQIAEGYVVDQITVTPAGNFKNFKANDDGSYRITKVKGDVTVNVTTKKASSGEGEQEACVHEYANDWAVLQAPTCYAAGIEHRFCTKCQKEEQREIAQLTHEYAGDRCRYCDALKPNVAVNPKDMEFYLSADTASGLDGEVQIKLKSSNGSYSGTIFLPGTADLSKTFLHWKDAANITVKSTSGTEYQSGQAPIASAGKSVLYRVTSGNYSATITFTTQQGSESVAGMFLTIDESKGTINAMNSDPDHETSCYGSAGFGGSDYYMSIKGRGNWTWAAGDKKPYNITLYSDSGYSNKKKTEFIDGIKSNKWTLIANYADGSMMHNKISYDLACKLGIGMESRYVDIWMNGEYVGNYLMTAKTDFDVPSGGYLLELDNNYDTEDPYFRLDGLDEYNTTANVITVKKVGSRAEASGLTTENIQSWMQKMLNAVMDSGSDEYLNYIDLDSWAKFYLIQEYSKNYDILAGSMLMHRDGLDDDDKLFAGPVWDLDVAWSHVFIDTRFGISTTMHSSAEGWYIDSISTATSFLQYLGTHKSFMTRVCQIFNEYQDAFAGVSSDITALKAQIGASAEMNYKVWSVTQTQYNATFFNFTTTRGSGTYAFTQVATRSWNDYVTNFKAYVDARYRFMSDNIIVEKPVGSLVEAAQDDKEVLSVALTSGAQRVTYQWQSGPNGILWNDINGATSATCDISNDPSLAYRCIVTNSGSTINTTREAKVAPSSVTVFTREQQQECFVASIACDAHSSVTVYNTQDVTAEGRPNASYAVARNADTGEIDASGEGQINFIAKTKAGHNIESVTVSPAENYKNLKVVDAEKGVYRITKVTGPLTVSVTTVACPHEYENGLCIHCGMSAFDGHIDLTDPESSKYITIENQTSTVIREGKGLYLTSTKEALEPANGQLSGNAATTPKDMVKIDAEGDWTATMKVDFFQNGSTGYYEFFGFYAIDDYQNMVGIRAGDNSIQDFLRKDGNITAETTGKKTSSGLKSASTHWFKIAKSNVSYDCYWSTDGETFAKVFSFENTGIHGDTIVLDAYSGMSTGYEYLVEYINIDFTCQHIYKPTIVPASCETGGYTLTACKLCGAGATRSDETEPLGHDYRVSTETPATAQTPGLRVWQCFRCSESYEEPLAMLNAVGTTCAPLNAGVLTGGGEYASGAEITLSARSIPGYTFVGWYLDGIKVTEDAIFKLKVNGDIDYEARFVANVEDTLTVETGKGSVVWSTTDTAGIWDEDQSGAFFPRGTKVTLTAKAPSNYEFLGWINAATGRVLSHNITMEITLAGETKVSALYRLADCETQHYVVFRDMDGTILSTTTAATGDAATAPAHGTFAGYQFIGWSADFSFVTSPLVVDALYKQVAEVVEPELDEDNATISLAVQPRADGEGGTQMIAMTAEWRAPEGKTVLEAGIVRCLAYATPTELTLDAIDGTNIKRNPSNLVTSEGVFAYTLTLKATAQKKTLWAVGYVTYIDDITGEVTTDYSMRITA